jgi:hypothetical protein
MLDRLRQAQSTVAARGNRNLCQCSSSASSDGVGQRSGTSKALALIEFVRVNPESSAESGRSLKGHPRR